MDLFDKKISAELIEEERLKGARLSVNFRWAFILWLQSFCSFNFLLDTGTSSGMD
jgi:hypothetical protein